MQIIRSIQNRIYELRGERVMLDRDLAALYETEIKVLNQSVKRNSQRFPPDFMFQLSKEELDSLRFQFETLEKGKGKHSKYLPYVFTEQGVAMLSGVLKSEKAVLVNLAIMRAFVKLRLILESNKELSKKTANDWFMGITMNQIFDAINTGLLIKTLELLKNNPTGKIE